MKPPANNPPGKNPANPAPVRQTGQVDDYINNYRRTALVESTACSSENRLGPRGYFNWILTTLTQLSVVVGIASYVYLTWTTQSPDSLRDIDRIVVQMQTKLQRLEDEMKTLSSKAREVDLIKQSLKKFDEESRTLSRGFERDTAEIKLKLQNMQDDNEAMQQKLQKVIDWSSLATKTNDDAMSDIRGKLRDFQDELKTMGTRLQAIGDQHERDAATVNGRLRSLSGKLQELEDAHLCQGAFCSTTFKFKKA
jgi:myosin heavy subunit